MDVGKEWQGDCPLDFETNIAINFLVKNVFLLVS